MREINKFCWTCAKEFPHISYERNCPQCVKEYRNHMLYGQCKACRRPTQLNNHALCEDCYRKVRDLNREITIEYNARLKRLERI